MSFDSLPAPLRDALTARGYAAPTAVQSAVLTPEAAGRDLLVSAQTGSGKTVAYGLALAPELIGDAPRLPPAGPPLALVVAPTRELALQVKAELAWLYAPAGGRIVSCVGGMDPVAERRQLSHGAHIVVGTPGRLRDHLERGNLAPAALRAVVLDEADEMLDLGFKEELEAILDETPAERRTLLFSATVPRGIAALAKGYQRDALRIEATSQAEPHGDIEYRAAIVAPHEIERAVVNILRLEDARISMVFCATRATVARLHGNLSENLRDGRARVCVATDVAARGIDLPDLGLVIHAELPRDPDTLLHRSGRTGRAGRKGVSVLLVPHTRRSLGQRLIAAARVKATWGPAPSVEAVRARDDERLGEQALALVTEEPNDADIALARRLLTDPAFAAHGPEAVTAALLHVLRGPLPAPEELSEINERPSPRQATPRRENTPLVAEGEEGIWFRMDVGRDGRADPKWLLPFLCRRGHVTRQEIGRIRILSRETQFEVAPYAAARFAAAARKADGDDAHIHIIPMQPVKAPAHRSRPPMK